MLFFWFFKNCELIRNSSLWRSNFIPSVCDSIVIIGSRSVTYIFGSRFTYKRWVRVLSKICILAFLDNYSNTVCWVSKRVDWVSHQLLLLLGTMVPFDHELCLPSRKIIIYEVFETVKFWTFNIIINHLVKRHVFMIITMLNIHGRSCFIHRMNTSNLYFFTFSKILDLRDLEID